MTTATASRARSSRRPARHQLLFLASLALIALHVIDDSFLQPQPGTSAADHLVSGLVPLTALALAAAAFLRVRAGGRAVIALVAGFFGVVVGVEAVHYTTHGGPSGDDFTGLLAIPAGLALLGLGLQTLWTGRRRDTGLVRTSARRGAIALASAVGFVFLLFPIAYAYVGTHAARPPVADIDLGNATVEDVELHTSDGLTLEGSYVPSRNGAAVIVAFGRKGTQPHARYLARHGYGVLIFDRRGEGESDGDPNPYAWNEGERDLDAAIEFLKGRPGCRVRSYRRPRAVRGRRDLPAGGRAQRRPGCRRLRGRKLALGRRAPSVPGGSWPAVAMNSVITPATAVFSNSAPPPHLVDLVDEIAPRPMFLIYASEGTGGEEKRANRAFYRAAGGPKAIWEIPEAGHVGGLEARPREYEQRVTGFFDRSLRGDERG